MVDEVFQQVRIGKHVDATRAAGELAARSRCRARVAAMRYYVAEQALRWDSPPALNTIGSTLIRHLLRSGRPDAALAVFERLRTRAPNFTMDSAHDLRTLAEYAESVGREELAHSDAAGNAGLPARTLKPAHDSCQQRRLTAAT